MEIKLWQYHILLLIRTGKIFSDEENHNPKTIGLKTFHAEKNVCRSKLQSFRDGTSFASNTCRTITLYENRTVT